MTVKEAKTVDELEAIIALRYKILRQPWDQSFETSRDELEEKSWNAYVADHKGRVLACGRLQDNGDGVGQIRYMAVEEECRGKGLGKKILKYLEKKAQILGINKIVLQARENALQFYLSNGYKQKEKSFLLWGEVQHYSMERDLSINRQN
jgi:N-acetylglutamate synthase-like GNAT family acetyltransferase